jgi:hypothetical protein
LKKTLAVTLIALLIPLYVDTAAGATQLSLRAAKHALRVDLAHGYGIRHVSATCRRRSRVKFTCKWTGRRGGKGYAGRATVVRTGRSTSVQLTHVHRR